MAALITAGLEPNTGNPKREACLGAALNYGLKRRLASAMPVPTG